MSDRSEPDIERRYGPQAAEEWRLVLRHFELAGGFALIVLTVPDRLAAGLCRHDLAAFLLAQGKSLTQIVAGDPQALGDLATRLLNLPDDPAAGAVWVEAVTSERAGNYPVWNEAWHRALGSLNQQRNPLRRRLNVPLLIVGAPWVAATMREIAPDLWSVRALVAMIEPDATHAALPETWQPVTGVDAFASLAETSAPPDIALAQRAAQRLRDAKGQERVLAEVLGRLAQGLGASGDWPAAEAAWREAAALRLRFGPPTEAARASAGLSQALWEQGRGQEAFDALASAVALYRSHGTRAELAGSLNNLAVLLDNLARPQDALAAASEAVAIHRSLQATQSDSPRPVLALSLSNLANMLSRLGRLEDALTAAEEALSIRRDLAEQHPGLYQADLADSLISLANIFSALGRREDALAVAEEAVARNAEAIPALLPQFSSHPDVFANIMRAMVRDYIAGCQMLGRNPDMALLASVQPMFKTFPPVNAPPVELQQSGP